MSATPVAYNPAGEPTERRKFQLTNLDGNNNKYYVVDLWPLPNGDVYYRASYGRVGASPQMDEKVVTRQWVERKIREKIGKGYQEVKLHQPVVAPPMQVAQPHIDRKVQDLVATIHAEAGLKIASYLAVDLQGLSMDQIAQGRDLLLSAQQQHQAYSQAPAASTFQQLATSVQAFYNVIPTQLPSRIDRQQVVEDFCRQFDEHEDRLNQLEAALATAHKQQHTPGLSLYDALGAELALVPQNDRRYGDVCDYIDRTCVHGYKVRVRDVFAVTVPGERRAWERNTRGRQQVVTLFHGTASQNIAHILRGGLICPRVPSNGRMFGDGIYFANRCTKSVNYCSVSRRGVPHMLFLADVAIGRPYVAPQAMTGIKAAPQGYDSVLGQAGHTGSWSAKLKFDEYIVYNTAQQTLRYLVTFDR